MTAPFFNIYDPLMVRITFASRVPSVLGLLTNYAGGFIISKKTYEERGTGFSRNPIGIGPFQVQSIVPGTAATFVANDSYFRGKPKLTYRFLSNTAARGLAFLAGEVDAAGGLTDKRWLQRTLAQPGTAVDSFDPAELAMLHINVTKPPFDDIRVRQALAYAADGALIADFRGPRFSQAGKSADPSNNLGFTDKAGALPHDPAKAKVTMAFQV